MCGLNKLWMYVLPWQLVQSDYTCGLIKLWMYVLPWQLVQSNYTLHVDASLDAVVGVCDMNARVFTLR